MQQQNLGTNLSHGPHLSRETTQATFPRRGRLLSTHYPSPPPVPQPRVQKRLDPDSLPAAVYFAWQKSWLVKDKAIRKTDPLEVVNILCKRS
ncbi:hypothetical protein HNY73_013882 [Argiope bruennichi]|uniref:Uncharacterized protein n=1 Tax=Argiope bruennichi TaxID=94029 RepID=A0A8T0ENB1_ARGBR|nr:hypothetical protein HNY73_013882 [Argiope bruennichi]